MAGSSAQNDDPDLVKFLGGTSDDYFVTRR